MPFLEKLERLFGRFAIPNITLYIVIGQVFVFVTATLGVLNPELVAYWPFLAFHGQWWRIVTFIAEPPSLSVSPLNVVGLAFGWWIFYFMGSALEGYWGAFRYNLFLATGWALTIGVSLLQPLSPVSNIFLGASVFLSFAYLHPEFEIYLFYILPVKIRWLALATWVYGAFVFIRGSWPARLQMAAAVGNIILFFGRDIWLAAGRKSRITVNRVARSTLPEEPRHRCRICGKTDLSNPELDFRYCSKCAGGQCYCPEHIFNHEHVLGENEGAKR
ncbi:MAG: hypothetical protein ABSA05_10725 [Opitutaceae bacterium]|jgi:hypothetical protein